MSHKTRPQLTPSSCHCDSLPQREQLIISDSVSSANQLRVCCTEVGMGGGGGQWDQYEAGN